MYSKTVDKVLLREASTLKRQKKKKMKLTGFYTQKLETTDY